MPLPRDDQPLTSATYIPGVDSFGPGVGIPPLSFSPPAAPSPKQSQTHDFFRSSDNADTPTGRNASTPYTPGELNATPRSEKDPWNDPYSSSSYQQPSQRSAGSTTAPVSQQTLFPQRTHSSTVHSPSTPLSKKNFVVQPAKEKQEYSSPVPQGLGIESSLGNPVHGLSKRDRERSVDRHVALSEDRAWPLDRVLTWLDANDFSRPWQDAFRHLNLYGSHFLNIGRPGAKSSLSTRFHTLYPQIEKECAARSLPYDHAQTRDEGKRARRLIRAIVELGIVQETPQIAKASSKARQPTSQQPQQWPQITPQDPQAPVSLETSPMLPRRRDPFAVSTPSTAGTGDDSPGRQFSDQQALLSSRRYSRRAITFDALTSMASRDGESPSSTSSKVPQPTESLRPSPAVSSDRNDGTPRSLTDPSPHDQASARSLGSSQYRLQALDRLSSSDPPSSEASTPNDDRSAHSDASRFQLAPSANDGENLSSQASGVEPARHSGEPSREHKGFLKTFMGRNRRKDDSHDEASPTSPISLRHGHSPIAAISKFGKTHVDALTGNKDLLSAEADTATVKSNGTARTLVDPGDRRYIMVTPDGWNYRLIDVSAVDSASSMKALICYNLGLTYSSQISFYTTQPGQTEHVEPISDAFMQNAKSRHADALASLKVYVRAPGLGQDIASATVASGVPASPFGQESSIDEATLARLNGEVESNGGRSESSTITPKNPVAPEKAFRALPEIGLHNRETISLPEDQRFKILAAKREEHLRETERKQKAYLASRRMKIDTHTTKFGDEGPGIRRSGGGVIDFDQPRHSPYDDKRPSSFEDQSDQTVPFRSAPPPPPKPSTTLLKANSLIKRASQDSTKDRSEDSRQRVTSGSIAEMPDIPSLGYGRRYDEEDDLRGNRPSLTLQMPGGPDTLRSRASRSNRKRSPQRIKSSRFSRKSYGPSFHIPNDNVEFHQVPALPTAASADSDEDSDDGLFAVALKKDSEPNTASDITSLKPLSSSSQPTGDSAISQGHSRDSSEDATPNPLHSRTTGSLADSGDESDLRRRDSFTSDVWANRPPAEALVEHLDHFFPNVDLDQLVIDEGSASSLSDDSSYTAAEKSSHDSAGRSWMDLDSSRNTTPPSSDHESDTVGSDELNIMRSGTIKSVARRNIRKSGALGRTKSIREVVKGAYSMSRRPSALSGLFSGASERVPSMLFPSPIPIPSMPPLPPNRVSYLREQGIARRKSTKMFGAKIEQIKPARGSRFFPMDVIRDSLQLPVDGTPTQEQPNFPKPPREFKWMRGQMIGKGSFGKVYLGMNMTTGELLAVKQVEVNPKVAKLDPAKVREMVDALDGEIDTMQHLDHENIVQYLGCERKEFAISIFLEYIPGGSIGSCLRKHGKFEESVVVSLTRQTLDGLAYLHRAGILHRDLKADNILLDLDGICKISDFGISKRSKNVYNNDTSNSMQGSVFWMAPEVIRAQSQPLDASGSAAGDNQGYSAKVDIWSLGCVVLEMLCGHRPWQKEEAIGAIYKLGSLNQPPPIPTAVSSIVGKATMDFMNHCFTM